MAYEYLIFGGTLILAALLGTGAGAIQNGSFSNHPETIIVNVSKPKSKPKKTRKPFENTLLGADVWHTCYKTL